MQVKNSNVKTSDTIREQLIVMEGNVQVLVLTLRNMNSEIWL
jgi:hypothetical protein